MRRAAIERPLMLRRLRVDEDKHRDGPPCKCSPGRFRKRRPLGCPAGSHCICKMDRQTHDAPAMRRARIGECEQAGWLR